jgi:transcriptional regulator with XRE-family HTH domain
MHVSGEKIGNRLKELRQSAGLSQVATAEALKTPLRTYQGWEKDFTSSIQNLIKICNYFNNPVETLIKNLDPDSTWIVDQPEIEDYKIKIFRSAITGADYTELFDWFKHNHPEKADGIDNPEQFIENCILDIYHIRPSFFNEYNFPREKEKEKEIGEMFDIPKEQITIVKSGHIPSEVIREILIAPYGASWIIKWAAAKPGFRIGISNGFTTSRILNSIQRGSVRNSILFPLNFTNTPVDFPISSTALISSFLYRSIGYGISTDTVNEEQVFSSMLLTDAALLGIGNFDREGLYERMIRSVLGQNAVSQIRKKGIVGDLNYNLFNKDGIEIELPEIVSRIGEFEKNSLVKAIGLKQLSEKADRGSKIVIAGTGEHKADSVAISLRKRYANHLITDETIANKLLGL